MATSSRKAKLTHYQNRFEPKIEPDPACIVSEIHGIRLPAVSRGIGRQLAQIIIDPRLRDAIATGRTGFSQQRVVGIIIRPDQRIGRVTELNFVEDSGEFINIGLRFPGRRRRFLQSSRWVIRHRLGGVVGQCRTGPLTEQVVNIGRDLGLGIGNGSQLTRRVISIRRQFPGPIRGGQHAAEQIVTVAG